MKFRKSKKLTDYQCCEIFINITDNDPCALLTTTTGNKVLQWGKY